MSLLWFVVGAFVVLGAGYHFYGRWIAARYALDDERVTPAARFSDGVDFVPTRPFYLLGQHFSAIAAAGPIAGPILACQQFGWLPCVLWIGLGVVFIGAVHDFSTLVASVRHDGRSIAEIVKQQIGPRAWLAMTAFIWLALVYVIVAFTDITASTFVSGDADLAGLEMQFNPGGAVAAASTAYLGLALAMGAVEKWLRPKLWIQTLIFVPATLGAVWFGTQVSAWLLFDVKTWVVVILLYCFAASVMPVWSLLQPRGYLGGFVLYLALAAGVAGVLLGGFEVQQPAFRGFVVEGKTGPVSLFPFLFVTIACGACSGFHGLVCSGTTSKQIAKESHCRAVGYGAMLLEAFVAILALATVLIVRPEAIAGKAPGAIYGEGLGRFLAVVLGQDLLAFSVTFGAMAFSTFVFDTLDVTTRLGRYLLQELIFGSSRAGALAATAATIGVPALFLLNSGPMAYLKYWPLFGTSNQLLAALSLLGVTVWLRRTGKPFWFTALPAAALFAITLTALISQIGSSASAPPAPESIANGVAGALLLLLALTMLVLGLRRLLTDSSQLAKRSHG